MHYKYPNSLIRNLSKSILLLFLISCVACKNSTKSDEKKDHSSRTNQSTLEGSGNISDLPLAKSLPFLIEPCESSTNYQKNNWPGENSCIWAMQKELLEDLPEYVIKKEDGLSFQTDNAGWRTLINTKDNQLMLNAYLPEHHLFILKYFNGAACEKYGIFDPRLDKLTDVEGAFYLSPDRSSFATLPSLTCDQDNAIIGSFSRDKRVVTKTIKVSNPVLSLRWNEDKVAISSKKEGNTESYQMIDLP